MEMPIGGWRRIFWRRVSLWRGCGGGV